MLTFVPFEDMTEKHVRLLAESIAACPEFHRPLGADMLEDLRTGKAKMFEFDKGIMVLSVEEHNITKERRLMIDAWSGDGSIFCRVEAAVALRRIAAEWKCDVIETLVFDLRLASAICSIGGHVESVCVTLPARVERVH